MLYFPNSHTHFRTTLGTCIITNGSSYQCLCPSGWTDTNCNTPVNPCASMPCRNNGQCLSFGNQFNCLCSSGFNGTFCEIPINPCDSNPCKYCVLSFF